MARMPVEPNQRMVHRVLMEVDRIDWERLGRIGPCTGDQAMEIDQSGACELGLEQFSENAGDRDAGERRARVPQCLSRQCQYAGIIPAPSDGITSHPSSRHPGPPCFARSMK